MSYSINVEKLNKEVKKPFFKKIGNLPCRKLKADNNDLGGLKPSATVVFALVRTFIYTPYCTRHFPFIYVVTQVESSKGQNLRKTETNCY